MQTLRKGAIALMFNKGERVRYTSDGRVGEITGKHRERGDAWQVLFNGVDRLFIPSEKLERVNVSEDVYDLFQNRRFMGISDFRRRMYRYRMSGDLTNFMYSMDNAVATFMPHQFIPVLKFLESYTDRLLIADEVGLGKTIEAMYIWEELRARKNAKRLLVVVPAVLREKWKGDMHRFFNIDAEIVSAQGRGGANTLLSSIKEAREDPSRKSFVLIVSLEGVRTAEEVRNVLTECIDASELFDLTIIDEAHYLRNSSTEGFRTGELLRDVSKHLLLLSATPIQTSSENFFNLLSLLAPEDFTYRETFEAQLAENRPLVQLANSLECNEPEGTVRTALNAALANEVFSTDADLLRMRDNLGAVLADPHERVVLIDRIKGKYFYSGLVTRSRKRDVFQGRTQRDVTSVNFRLSEYERQFYEEVSRYLRAEDRRSQNGNAFSTFRLIARQRQMSSCIPAALMSWRGMGADGDFDEEYAAAAADGVGRATAIGMPSFENYDLDELRAHDTKFETVLARIQSILKDEPREKIVIFSFFRNTVRYLFDRFSKEGISAEFIMGGLTPEEKTVRLARFKNEAINILVSSEVGSEGIDLQFARYELNYDLPWNPMRLEQRIGRIDRIGQQSERIFICNAYCENTIEDRILARLYERIEIFRNVIGDLEEVMGEKIRDLEVNVFRAAGELTEEQINEKAEQIVHALNFQQQLNRNLELEAGVMSSSYRDFILGNIQNSFDAKRMLTSEELMFFCGDVLREKFPGSSVAQVEHTSAADVRLSDLARRGLANYIANNPSSLSTCLSYMTGTTRCNFGKKMPETVNGCAIAEVVDVNHPLVRWLLAEIEKSAIYTSGCDVVSLNRSQLPSGLDLEPGHYGYAVQIWKADGVRRANELRYYVAKELDSADAEAQIISGDKAEMLMVSVLLNGVPYDINLLPQESYNGCGWALEKISYQMENDFASFENDKRTANQNLVEEQSKYVQRTASIKAERIKATIEKMRLNVASGILTEKECRQREALIKANTARMENVLARRENRLENIRNNLECTPICGDVAIGILYIREE